MTVNYYFIYSADDEGLRYEVLKRKILPKQLPYSVESKLEFGAWLENELISISLTNTNKFSMSVNELMLIGKHNTGNSMAAAISGKVLGIKNEIIRKSLSSFKGVEHRLEPLAFGVRGVKFVNDSKATNVNSTWYALECIDGPIVWIAGGTDKGNDYSMLKEIAKEKVKALVCLGIDNRKLIDAFGEDITQIVETDSMADAVKAAMQ